MATTLTSVVLAPDQILITRKPLPDGIVVDTNDIHAGKVIKAGVNVVYYADCLVVYRASLADVIQFVLNNTTYFIIPISKVIVAFAP